MVAAWSLKKDHGSTPLGRLCKFRLPGRAAISKRQGQHSLKTTGERKQEKTAQAAAGSAPSKLARRNRKQRREWARKIPADEVSLEVIHPDAAGIDIGNECPYVAVPSKRDPEDPVRRLGCVTAERKAMAEWLPQCGIRSVAMQSTGVYWIPV
jgi:hypothetical protein